MMSSSCSSAVLAALSCEHGRWVSSPRLVGLPSCSSSTASIVISISQDPRSKIQLRTAQKGIISPIQLSHGEHAHSILLGACLVPTPKSQKVLQSPSHRILRYVYGALNVDEKKLIAQFCWKLRDERFEPN